MGKTIRFGSPQWRDAWNFDTEAFRSEARQDYLVAGEHDPATRQGWLRRLEAARDRGATITRVRVIRYPLTPYTLRELADYAENAEAGEQVRIVDGGHLADAAERAGDYCLFDGRRLVRLNYDADGRPVDATLIRNPLLVQRARRLRARLLAASEPYADYMNRTASTAKTG